MPCFKQILNFIAMLIPCITCPHSSSFIHNWFIPWLMTKTCEIEEPFPHFDPYPWLIPCFVSWLWVVQQNLSKPWSFWARRTCRCWFPSLGELGFEALTSLVGCPWCLVLTMDIPPSFPRSCQLKLEAICLPSLHALWDICYILWNAKPANEIANCL